MGVKFNPLIFSGFDFTGAGTNPPILPPVDSVGDLPPSAPDGYIIVTKDTSQVWVYSGTDSRWVDSGLSESEVFGTTPTTDGYDIVLDDSVPGIRTRELVLQPADDTYPGAVSVVAQSFAGEKTFIDEVSTDSGITTGGDIIMNDHDITGVTNVTRNGGLLTISNTAGAILLESTDPVNVSAPRTDFIDGDVAVKDNKGVYLSPTLDASNGLKGIFGWVPEDPYAFDTYGGPAPVITMQADRTGGGGAPHDLVISTTVSHPTLVERIRLTAAGIFRIVSNVLDLNSNAIINVADPSNAQDAATKNYVDLADAEFVRHDGTVPMSGNLNLDGNLIINVANPVSAQDAATKDYVDDADALKMNVDFSNATAAVNDVDMGGFNITDLADPVNPQDAETNAHAAATYIPLTQKAAALGVATLDGGGKIPVTQLPNSVMELKGFWNANTNTPTLTDGTGNPGDVWEVDVAGTTDFGNGPITFAIGDWAVYAADGEYHKSLNSNAVTSVNGYTGTVVLDTDDISEGATNLYFTDVRAQTAAVDNTIVDGITDVAPSQNAVFDALALKANVTLNNLSSTAVNASIIPATDITVDLGSPTNRWSSILGMNLGIDGIYNSTAGGPGGVVDVFASELDLQGNAITNVVNPTNPQDVATKDYVDDEIAGIPSGANTALSNLAAVAINTGLVFGDGIPAVLQTFDNPVGNSEEVTITSGAAGSGFNTGDVTIKAADSDAAGGYVEIRGSDVTGGADGGHVYMTSGSGDTQDGNVVLDPRTTGNIQFKKNHGVAGYVWTSIDTDGSGEWQVSAGGGANTSLSNLVGPTAINESLIFGPAVTGILKSADDAAGSYGVQISTGDSTGAFSGPLDLYTGASAAGDGSSTGAVSIYSGHGVGAAENTGAVSLFSGNATGSSASGNLTLGTGTANDATGGVQIRSGDTQDGLTGNMDFRSGTPQVTGNSGGVAISSGGVVSGTSGDLSLLTGDSNAGGGSGLINISTGTTNDVGQNSGSVVLASGTANLGPSGSVTIATGQTGGDNTQDSGGIQIITGTATAGANTGVLNLSTGEVINGDGTKASGQANFYSGNADDGNTGILVITSGNVTGVGSTGNSGYLHLRTGTVTSGVRGQIRIEDGSEGTAGHVWTSTDTLGNGEWAPASGGGGTWAKQVFTLNGTDITNQYVILSNTPIANSTQFVVRGGGIQMEGASYEYSVAGAQINFLNDLATGGSSALISGDIICVQYQF